VHYSFKNSRILKWKKCEKKKNYGIRVKNVNVVAIENCYCSTYKVLFQQMGVVGQRYDVGLNWINKCLCI